MSLALHLTEELPAQPFVTPPVYRRFLETLSTGVPV